MTRKVLFLSLLSLVLSICTSVVCFANTDSQTVSLGNEVTSSIEKGMDSVRNAADGVMDGGARLMRDGANTIDNMTDGNNGYNNNDYYNNNYYNNNNYNNRNTTDYNRGYNTVRTGEQGYLNNNTTMSTTTWIWIIVALAAVIIVAAIWYYAMQGNDRD